MFNLSMSSIAPVQRPCLLSMDCLFKYEYVMSFFLYCIDQLKLEGECWSHCPGIDCASLRHAPADLHQTCVYVQYGRYGPYISRSRALPFRSMGQVSSVPEIRDRSLDFFFGYLNSTMRREYFVVTKASLFYASFRIVKYLLLLLFPDICSSILCI